MIAVFLLNFIFGHYISALFLYLVHRFIFHGTLRRWPVFKNWARLHGLHHADVSNIHHMLAPFWVKCLLFSILVLTALLIHPGFALGIASFGLLYMYRHWAIHQDEYKTKFYYHHMYHHHNVKVNFSGMYPFIDKIFGTYTETRPSKIKSK